MILAALLVFAIDAACSVYKLETRSMIHVMSASKDMVEIMSNQKKKLKM